MAKMGQEQLVPATRELLREVGDALDVGTTILQKEALHINNAALNQLHALLQEVADQFRVTDG